MPRSSNGRAASLHGADGSSILSRGTIFADVAQLVEQRIENPCVTGSNPVFGTKQNGP